MNICIYRIMRNQWYSQTVLTEGERNVDNRLGHFFSRRRTKTLSAAHIRRGGQHEAEYKKRDAQYTRASVFMVVAFVVCNTPRFIPNVMEIFIELNKWPQVRIYKTAYFCMFSLLTKYLPFFKLIIQLTLEKSSMVVSLGNLAAPKIF